MKSWTVSQTEAGTTAWKYVTRLLPAAAGGLLRKSMRKKNITLNGKKMEGKEKLSAGDRIDVWFSDETISKFQGEIIKTEKKPLSFFPSCIVYEDENVLVLNKPAGLLSQGDGSCSPSLNDGLLSYLKDEITPAFRPSICNRLDRNTSGMVLAGKNMAALQTLNELIRTRAVEKIYSAVVFGKTEKQGTFKGWMVKDEIKNRVLYLDHEETGARSVETSYERIAVGKWGNELVSLVKVHLITGRSHQIRVHFANAGHPLLGDRKYGTKESIALSTACHIKRQLLHAGEIRFPDNLPAPLEALSGKTFTADLPEDMKNFMVSEIRVNHGNDKP
ncbi:RluA family pseudouridine synthase [uncultured Dialister sp.]|uniref:RluA family pseudouridine synthase n=1 Tax=uncultured Dialister sp. TaxID=278064 RepID=UPI002606EEE0|nr:RluA family pseudouridine synthase [uncultured Dialister sp.]